MKIELVRDTPKVSGALTGRVYVDGSLFGYSLENNFYKFPNGNYDLVGKYSPSFKKNKVYISVPDRTNIMFHGGNTLEDVKGCVIVAQERDGETVKGDLSQKLFDVVDAAGRSGDSVGLVVRSDYKKILIVLGVVGALGAYWYFSKR